MWLGALLAALCGLWAVASHHVQLLALRELLRFGETVGVTPTAASGKGRLAGQILGFNYSRPPPWYELLACTLAFAAVLLPVFWPVLGVQRRRLAGRRFVPTTWLRMITRALAALLIAGGVYAAFEHALGVWLWLQLIRLGEGLGGSVTRISGPVAVGPGGPFSGGTVVDAVFNVVSRHGPVFILAVISCSAALAAHALLWRSDLRDLAAARVCPGCGYDLSATPAGAPCPECGRAGGDPSGPTRSAHTRASAPGKLHT